LFIRSPGSLWIFEIVPFWHTIPMDGSERLMKRVISGYDKLAFGLTIWQVCA
jgi:hypothetical protein